jgi:hypothetical protein
MVTKSVERGHMVRPSSCGNVCGEGCDLVGKTHGGALFVVLVAEFTAHRFYGGGGH